MGSILWLICSAILLVIELLLPSPLTIWFAFSTGTVGTLSFVIPTMPWYVRLILFIVVTIILFIVFPKKKIEKVLRKIKHLPNDDTDISYVLKQQGVVKEKIDNAAVLGLVEINGVLWRALSSDNSVIDKGCLVDVVSTEGNRLYVKKSEGGDITE